MAPRRSTPKSKKKARPTPDSKARRKYGRQSASAMRMLKLRTANRARARGGAATAAQAEAVSASAVALSPALFVQIVVHALGHTPGRAVCGLPLPTESNAVHGLMSGPTGEATAQALGDAMRAALAHYSGSGAAVVACRGCEVNVARMAKAGGGRTKAKAKTKAEAKAAEAAACPPDDDEAP